MGDNNDHKKGIYEIVYDEDKIREIQSLDYKKFYSKFGSHELAAQASRPGLVYEDVFWLILRDCVITPKGVKLTYHRLIQKSELNQCVGAAVMPIITLPNGETKISLILHYRHATQSWEFELPRGSSEPGETPEQTARRELREETGYEVEGPLHLGTFPPNSGALSSLVPVFSGRVTIDRGEEEIDEEEAIKGKFLFTFDEIMQALKSPDSCLEVIIDGEKKRYPVRDPFLYCALLLSDL
jgi:ADP-ribose pyrophosphatase